MDKAEQLDDAQTSAENVPDNSRYLSLDDIKQYRLDDEGVPTDTSMNQKKVEDTIEECLSKFFDRASVDPELPKLAREHHIELLCRSLSYLSGNYECLDASRPWLCYWILHALDVLGHTLPVEQVDTVTAFLARCQSAEGGFGGGPGQLPHLAATYAAVSALASLGTEAAYQVIDRPGLRRFLRRCLNSDGSFSMHDDGEVDIRGAYCAAAVARLTNVYEDALFEKTAEWLSSCQTYEGGFSGTPGLEAHGGYTFCGLAALALLGHERLCDLDSLMRWVTNRQMALEGGFSGRTQKLVDACYAYWQGAVFPIIHTLLAKEGSETLSRERWMFHQEALQHYLLHCCENAHGGFFDKPGKNRDFYHTCYALSGLSIAQNFHLGRQHHPRVVGHQNNQLVRSGGHQNNQLELVHPIYNLVVTKAIAATEYFSKLAVPTEADCSKQAGSPREADLSGGSPEERSGPAGDAAGAPAGQ
ncbi:protein farnesyltransferase subunit beta-like isoform X1 [Amphibalanus amphitrite]|uniref:protein farnesyltransferase subunit beta-like isoform X1 n=1 Tax=Amphibalanus amphitrite TaxID=1232801 RepID=UPI001C91FA37|nr:protein farnesyltransferase subunit beta-like isoform X1 [Amphibalanus amphitrite]XP_043203525.1 protein farnesyltransferase subunit beta-like isoform X1 [Amphibalanus amphitrite]XP_043203526.1 protein farnesyltransferase subunit beta-like isoform X1 [Amphibalanus amphitrite]